MQYCLWVNLIYGCTTTNLIYMTHIGPSTLNRCLNPIYSTMLTGTMSFTVKLPVAFVILLCLFIFCCMVCCKNSRYVVCALGCAGHPKQCLLLCLSSSFEAWVVSFPCVNLILNYSHRHWPLGWVLSTVYWPCLMYASMKSLFYFIFPPFYRPAITTASVRNNIKEKQQEKGKKRCLIR